MRKKNLKKKYFIYQFPRFEGNCYLICDRETSILILKHNLLKREILLIVVSQPIAESSDKNFNLETQFNWKA